MKSFLMRVLMWVLVRLFPWIRPRRIKNADRGVPVGRPLVFSYRRGREVNASVIERDLAEVCAEKGIYPNAYRVFKTEDLQNGERQFHIQPYLFDENQENEVAPSAMERYKLGQ